MGGFGSFVRKEALHILRDPRTMLIVLLMPVVQMLLFGFAISTEVNNIDFAAVVPRHSEEIRRQVIYDDRPYEDRARDLLKAFEAHDPDGVLLALSGRRLREYGVAAGIWQDGGESAHPDEGE